MKNNVRLPGSSMRNYKTIMFAFLVLMVFILIGLLYLDKNLHFIHAKVYVPAIAIICSSLVGGYIALAAVISNRKEFVRKNTIEQLNQLDRDIDYWNKASELIKHIKQLGKEGENHDLSITIMKKLNVHDVLRPLEWLMESAYNGNVDVQLLANRKAAMIDFLYNSCKKVIEDKQDEHCRRYSAPRKNTKCTNEKCAGGKCTSRLVYKYISDDEYRTLLCELAENYADYQLDIKHLKPVKEPLLTL